jgi:ubiquinone/menaquinone biosynthesis C-methylase UbiE
MDARLQLRIQRYGWDLAAAHYDESWKLQLADVQAELLNCASIVPGERVLDVACGTGGLSLQAARAAGPAGNVLGVDLSERMVQIATQRAADAGLVNARFVRADAQSLELSEAQFDVVLCSLGLMYVPQPEAALREVRRSLRPGGRVVLSVWGERMACGWASVFPVVDAEVRSEVCPLFFRLGHAGELARACRHSGLEFRGEQRLRQILVYDDDRQACEAAFAGGPVALAWSRFDQPARARASARYLESIQQYRNGTGYQIPAEFVLVSALAPLGDG